MGNYLITLYHVARPLTSVIKKTLHNTVMECYYSLEMTTINNAAEWQIILFHREQMHVVVKM